VLYLSRLNVLKAVLATSHETLSGINDRMHSLLVKYSKHRYMPQPLTTSAINGDGVIPGTASERWCLLRILPFLLSIIPDKIFWETYAYLNLREICDIVFAKQIPKAFVPYLSVCISNFLQHFYEAFPGVRMTPKMHFLVHYPRYLQLIGSLTAVWTMRFERKHCPLKQLARRIKNWKNVCMSLAKSHQLNQCHMFSAQTMFKTETVTSRACKVKTSDLPNALVAALSQYISETEFWQSYSVSNETVNIKCNFTYPLRFTDLELPLFFYCIQHFSLQSTYLFLWKVY